MAYQGYAPRGWRSDMRLAAIASALAIVLCVAVFGAIFFQKASIPAPASAPAQAQATPTEGRAPGSVTTVADDAADSAMAAPVAMAQAAPAPTAQASPAPSTPRTRPSTATPYSPRRPVADPSAMPSTSSRSWAPLPPIRWHGRSPAGCLRRRHYQAAPPAGRTAMPDEPRRKLLQSLLTPPRIGHLRLD